MTQQSQHESRESNQRKTRGLRSYRRDVMKAVGAGTALGIFGGTVTADEHENEDDEENGLEEEEVEEEAEEEDEEMEYTVHVVRTLITESTNPERPADFFYEPTGLHVEPGDVVKFVFETPDHTVTSYHPAFGMQRRIPAGVQPFSSPILGWEPASLPDDIAMPPGENGEAEEDGENGEVEEDNENGEAGEDNENGEAEAVEQDEEGPRPSTWLHSFDTPGVYDLECAPHEAFGMAMRIVVGEETETEFGTSDPDELPPPRTGPVELSRQVLTDPNLEPDNIVDEGRVEWSELEANQEPENGEEDETENGTEAENGNGEEDEAENGVDE